MLRKIWDSVINIGLKKNPNHIEAKTIRLTNGITLLTILMGFNFYPNLIYFLPETFLLLILLSSSLSLYLLVFCLNYFQLHTFAKIYLLLIACFNLSLTSILLGREQNFHFYLIAIIAVAFFIFEERELRVQYFIVSLVTLVFIGLEIWFSIHPGLIPFPKDFLFFAGINNNLGLLFLVVGFLYFISSNYKKAQIALEDERQKSESLLHNILPVPIADRLKKSRIAIADGFDSVSILFADIVGFTPLSGKMKPAELVSLLNKIFSDFDVLVEENHLEKIKTIGDAFMVAGGLPLPSNTHALQVAKFALEVKKSLAKINLENQQSLMIRIGIHSGPVVAGVIGLSKFSYDVWGDTVNIASRMESHCLPGEIQVSESTYQSLKEKFIFSEKRTIEIKGKGEMATYLLLGEK